MQERLGDVQTVVTDILATRESSALQKWVKQDARSRALKTADGMDLYTPTVLTRCVALLLMIGVNVEGTQLRQSVARDLSNASCRSRACFFPIIAECRWWAISPCLSRNARS